MSIDKRQKLSITRTTLKDRIEEKGHVYFLLGANEFIYVWVEISSFTPIRMQLQWVPQTLSADQVAIGFFAIDFEKKNFHLSFVACTLWFHF